MADFGHLPHLTIKLKSLRGAALALSTLMLILAILASFPALLPQPEFSHDPPEVYAGQNYPFQEAAFPGLKPSPTASLPSISIIDTLLTATPAPEFPFAPGDDSLAVLAVEENSYAHLFAYQPGRFPIYRLTTGQWQDIQPVISPDGTRLAFASNREGYWELYTLDLTDGAVRRITFSPEFDGSPSWSPDGLWLAYESYLPGGTGSDFEIFIRPVDGSQEPIRLTNDPAADHSPAWSPSGRKIAFVSDRGESEDVWLADLDKIDGRFENLSRNSQGSETHPGWSPDGNNLLWTMSTRDGLQSIMTWELTHPEKRPREVNTGEWAVWSPNGDEILAVVTTPNRAYLSGYNLVYPSLSLPLLSLNGPVQGITWGRKGIPGDIPPEFNPVSRETAAPLWQEPLTENASQPGNRVGLARLPNVEPANSMLQDKVDSSFQALRERVAREIGWDFLSTLEQSYVPLTAFLGPGMNEDWAYTGRAFRIISAPIQAGWMMVVREEYGAQTFWRIFLRARFQDGTQGIPLKQHPWDLFARLSGDPAAYENGGKQLEIPFGYWVDFTNLAAAYGWERLPALSTWRLAFSAARFDQFAFSGGLDWLSAMLEIYPIEALNTTTPIPSATQPPLPTLTPTRSFTPSRTPWLSRTPTPTKTPWSARTPTQTSIIKDDPPNSNPALPTATPTSS